MASRDLKEGDVVQLKSGGPPMTITGFNGDSAICQWFDKNKEPQARAFEVIALQPYKAPRLAG